MRQALSIAQIVISVLIIVAIILQAQGTGLGNNWSGGGETYHTRRGLEKMIFYATIVLVALFIVSSVANVTIL
jgi:preprotein translocase subunit SecG